MRSIAYADRRRGSACRTPAELLGRLVDFIGDVLGSSSLRLEIGPTLVILGVLLVLLQLVARPMTRWVTADAGGLAAIGRAMALAAEAGTDVVVSLGGAGIGRTTDALARLQTLAAMPGPRPRGRAAPRSGVPSECSRTIRCRRSWPTPRSTRLTPHGETWSGSAARGSWWWGRGVRRRPAS